MLHLASSFEAGEHVGRVAAIVVFAGLAIWLGLRARRQRTRRARITDALVASLCALLLAGAAARLIAKPTNTGWSSKQGRELRAGFLAGCEDSPTSAAVNCTCLFERLSNTPEGDTPGKFAKLGDAITKATSPDDAPPSLVAAVKACGLS